MLGLGLALSVGKKLLGDAIGRLIQKLSIRGTYSENLIDTRNIITDIDDADVLDKATILLTPTATSDALVHCVKDNTSDSDFDFDRASSATRINSDGLVQDMQSITDPELVLNGDFEELGDDLVTNGDFITSGTPDTSSYTLGWYSNTDGVEITNGKLTLANDASGAANAYATDGVSSVNILTTNKIYKLTFDITDNTNCLSFQIYQNAGSFVSVTNTVGSYTYYITNTSNSLFLFRNNTVNSSISLDNVSVQQVDPNDRWSLGTGWSISDGKLNFDTDIGDGTVSSTNILTVNNIYRMTFDVNITDGVLRFESGDGDNFLISSSGTYTHEFKADLLALKFRRNETPTRGYIDNVSVKDITFSTDVDLARINYDSNGQNGHILLEPTSTNLIPYSEDFTQGWSVSDATITPNSITSPSGQDNASTLTTSASGGTVQESLTISDGDLTFSLFVRKGTTNGVRLRIDAATDVNGYFNINDGTIFSQTDDAKIEVINVDWYRISISASVTSFVKASIYTTDGTTSYDNGTVYIWGAQLETLSFPTSYIPTLTGSAVTRATETLTGSGNSTLINSTEGVLYAEIAALANSGTSRRITISDGDLSDRVTLTFDTNNNALSGFILSNSSTEYSFFEGVTSALDFNKIAVKWKTNDFSIWINGVEYDVDTSGNAPSGLNTLRFDNGNNSSPLQPFYGKVKALAVFNEALSDTELQNLTS